jgi:spore germination cell wall hydrolase CwlJ-like protein
MGDGMLMTALTCLALNIYHEARSESFDGQYAVAHVVINRVQDHRWPDSICEVVKHSMMVAADVLRGEVPDFTGGSTHYHASYVKPEWADKMLYQGDWGSHYFFREYANFPKRYEYTYTWDD